MLLFTSLAIAIAVQVLADPLAGVLDRMAFSRSPELRADRAALRHTGAALPLRSADPLVDVDDDTFVRLTRRALGHYGDLTKLVASPLTALPVIDERLAARGAPDHPVERANELKAVLADGLRLKPRDGGDFGTTEQWRYYNSLYSRTSSGCAHTRRTPPPPDWTDRPAGLAVVGHRGPTALAAQLAERRGPAHRRRSARGSPFPATTATLAATPPSPPPPPLLPLPYPSLIQPDGNTPGEIPGLSIRGSSWQCHASIWQCSAARSKLFDHKPPSRGVIT